MTYKPPRAKMKHRLIFCMVGNCNFLTTPSGSRTMTMSMIQLGISSASRYVFRLKQCPSLSGCQALSTGVHWKAYDSVDAKNHMIQTTSMVVLAVRNHLSTRKSLRYSKSTLTFAAVKVNSATTPAEYEAYRFGKVVIMQEMSRTAVFTLSACPITDGGRSSGWRPPPLSKPIQGQVRASNCGNEDGLTIESETDI